MVFFHDTPENVNTLCTLIKGMRPNPAKAWLRCEGQSVNNPTNPLNILFYGRKSQVGKSGRFAVYASPEAGLKDAAWLINESSYYQNVRTALAKAMTTQVPAQADLLIARAIEDSPWAGGHYGGGGNKDGCIVRQLGVKPPPVPTPDPKPKPPPSGGKTYTVKPGDSLWAISEKFYGDGNQWRKIYEANKAVIGSNPSLIRPGQKFVIP